MSEDHIKVTVTQDDIDFGVPGRTDACAIVRAVTRLGYDNVEVDQMYITTGLFHNSRKWRVSDDVAEFIDRYDSGRDYVEPFEFEAEEA